MSMAPLLTLPDGRKLGPDDGYLPRIVGFTHEDREAKGLRKLNDQGAPRPPVHFTPAEMVAMNRAQLLHAPSGGGKTTLAAEFRRCLDGERQGDATFGLHRLTREVDRGPGAGCLPQDWTLGALPVLVAGPDDGIDGLADAEGSHGPCLLIVDDLQRFDDPEAHLTRGMDWLEADQDRRLLVLCESAALRAIRTPPALAVHPLLPVPASVRAALLARYDVTDTDPPDWIHPGPWSLSLAAGGSGSARTAALDPDGPPWLADARAADELRRSSPADAAARIAAAPRRLAAALDMLAENHAGSGTPPIARELAATGEPAALLAAARMTPAGGRDGAALAREIARVIEAGGAVPALRRALGEELSRLGDPRDLGALVDIPAGIYPMGGTLHPNSIPAHSVALRAFRIGRYPVTAGSFMVFIVDTGREWRSIAGQRPERRNHPATDLDWHEARAYCQWLTGRWRTEGRIGPDSVVRLPAESEWEAAARGADGLTWPWGEAWAPEHSNGDETGFNDICTVGLFPEGTSPFGCLDMAGQAWEWCTTLWGEDPSKPTYRYPWTDDGREALDGDSAIRRVLRGGCFSSPGAKANGVYRGSLEPAGFWRGNGFRIVVAEGDP